MKNKTLTAIVLVLISCGVFTAMLLRAQDRPAPRQTYEYALLKYDGPDRIGVFYPDHFDFYRVFEQGNALPKNAHDEEFCVNVAINRMARQGWEPIQLHATRVLFRRELR